MKACIDTIMEGRIYFTILGLLLAQALSALLLAFITPMYLIEIFFSILFLIAFITFMTTAFSVPRKGLMIASIAFILGFINVVYLVFYVVNLWLVIMLCLAAAGFFLTLDKISDRRPIPKNVQKTHKRKILDKELPHVEPAKVTVYHGKAKKRSKKSVTKKKATKKKVAKKKAVTKKKTSKRGRPKKRS